MRLVQTEQEVVRPRFCLRTFNRNDRPTSVHCAPHKYLLKSRAFQNGTRSSLSNCNTFFEMNLASTPM